jgi:hypothetical protein
VVAHAIAASASIVRSRVRTTVGPAFCSNGAGREEKVDIGWIEHPTSCNALVMRSKHSTTELNAPSVLDPGARRADGLRNRRRGEKKLPGTVSNCRPSDYDAEAPAGGP